MPDDTTRQHCPHCQTAYEIGAAQYGRKVRCGSCGQVFMAMSEPAVTLEPANTPPPFNPPPQVPRIKTRTPVAGRTRAHHINIAVLAAVASLLAFVALGVVVTADKTNAPDGSNPVATLIAGPILLVAFALLYFLPSVIAYSRDHNNILPIAIINTFFGWTLIGWVGSLAWALSSDIKGSRVYVKKVVVRGEADDEDW